MKKALSIAILTLIMSTLVSTAAFKIGASTNTAVTIFEASVIGFASLGIIKAR